jgi:hypothetical protein
VASFLLPILSWLPASCTSTIDFLDNVVNFEKLSKGRSVARANGYSYPMSLVRPSLETIEGEPRHCPRKALVFGAIGDTVSI